MDLIPNLSCDGFPTDSSTSSKSGVNFPCGGAREDGKAKDQLEPEPSCSKIFSSSSSSSTMSSALFQQECRLTVTDRRHAPNIGYEFSVAKSIMQQYSTLSGDNLFDHLADIIKRVIDERPPNVIDFFEEFSRNVREQKLHLPERFPPNAIFEERRMYRVAKRMLLSMKLPYPEDPNDIPLGEDLSEDTKSANLDEFKLDLDSPERLFITFNDRVQQLQFYWNQCGFSISSDDIFQLACAMDRLQTHPSILQCRFWGMMNGLRASYYVVEATLTRQEINQRMDQMEEELQAKSPQSLFNRKERPLPSYIGPELTPGGVGWENYPEEQLAQMQPPVENIPLPEIHEMFDIPPEVVGLGLNRNTYFVVNALHDEWIELPIVTPKQVVVSRHIKKFLTGDLETQIRSYPCFPGKEKHYLRAMIARITAGTYIAPDGYYRRMTKREQRLYNGIEDNEMEEEEEEEDADLGEGEDEDLDNDVLLLRNEKYEPESLNTLMSLMNWVHVRPAILKQGRIVWYDEELARREREKEMARLLKMQLAEEMGLEELEEENEEEEEEVEEEGLLDSLDRREIGPAILTSCDNDDASEEFTIPWVARCTSRFTNKNERVLVIQSKLWPGAYTFTFEKVCESIYMGWGFKYNARNMPFTHLRQMVDEYPHGEEDYIEASDPSVEEEEAYRQWLLNKLRKPTPDDIDEQIDEYDDYDDVEESAGSNAEN